MPAGAVFFPVTLRSSVRAGRGREVRFGPRPRPPAGRGTAGCGAGPTWGAPRSEGRSGGRSARPSPPPESPARVSARPRGTPHRRLSVSPVQVLREVWDELRSLYFLSGEEPGIPIFGHDLHLLGAGLQIEGAFLLHLVHGRWQRKNSSCAASSFVRSSGLHRHAAVESFVCCFRSGSGGYETELCAGLYALGASSS